MPLDPEDQSIEITSPSRPIDIHLGCKLEREALRARVAELEAENRILKNTEEDLRAFAKLCTDSAKKILGMPL